MIPRIKIILTFAFCLLSTNLHAETASQLRAKSINLILTTPMLQEFFKNDDGSMGSLIGIDFIKGSDGPTSDRYKINLAGAYGGGFVECTILARFDGKISVENVKFETPSCASR